MLPKATLAALTKRSVLTPAVALACASFATLGCRGSAEADVAADRASTALAAADVFDEGFQQEVEDRIREDVYWLADAQREGRGLGTAGLDASADYLAAEFAAAGLEPAGTEGYFQPFELTLGKTINESDTSLSIGGENLVLGEDFVPLAFSAPAGFEGELAFAGYAVRDSQAGYDDLDGVDLTGKVALVLRWELHDETGKSRLARGGQRYSRNAPLFRKVGHAAAAGAEAVLIVNPPRHHDDAPALMPFATMGGRQQVAVPAFHVTPDAADRMLAASGFPPLAELQDGIDREGKPTRVESDDALAVSGGWAGTDRKVTAKNVIGLLPGSGELADEYVVVGGHYDHIGHGGFGSRTPGSNEVHYGADDNASGTAAVIALAEMLAGDDGPADRRGVLFMGFSAEEIGLLGSDHWAKNATVPIESVAAMVNYDMLGRPAEGVLQVGGETTAAELAVLVEEAAEEMDVPLNRLGSGMDGRSDHASFHRVGVPAVFFFGSIHEDYHTPRDTPDKVDYDFLADATIVGYGVVRGLQTLEEKPVFVTREPVAGDRPQPARRVRLGVTPDMQAYGGDEAEGVVGVRVTEVAPGTPADKAGMAGGDVITKVGDVDTADIYGLQNALSVVDPGSTVPVVVTRGSDTITLQVTFDSPTAPNS